MPLKSRIVVCPYCDHEQKIKLIMKKVKCKECGKVFTPHEMNTDHHPREFIHHPLTSPHF